MELQDQFSNEEKSNYTERVNDILKLIKAYRQEKAKVNEPKIHADASAYLLDNLEQAFKDLINNLDMGRKQWFRQYQNISKNYRFGKSLHELWGKIGPQYDAFWFEMSVQGRKFVTMGSTIFWLPNFKNKGYEPLEMSLRKDFQEKLNQTEKYREIKIDVIKTVDIYQIRIPEIATSQVYTIVMHDCKVDVTVDKYAPMEMTDLLFNHLSEYLEV